MTTQTLPKLFSQNEDESVNEWQISTRQTMDGTGIITTRYGRVNGAIQETTDTVTTGKNIGKKNATTPYQQACKEAQSKWEKQKKKGYVETINHAVNGTVDTTFIQGGIEPMLAHKWRDHSAKMPLPALAQPKFDGFRCNAIIKNGKAELWSRTRKRITGVPHIVYHLEQVFAGKSVILDGELYNHEYKDRFEELSSFIRQQTAKPGHEVLEYHVYDVVLPGKGNAEREEWLKANIPSDHPKIKNVETVEVATKEEVEEYLADCLERGYEGCMVRSLAGTYQHKRSYNLLKVKVFEDAEFVIAGAVEGRGKMAGKAIFVCKVDAKKPTVFDAQGRPDTDDPNQFGVKMKGKLSNLSKYLDNKEIINKPLTVRYQNFTAYNKPRFPVGIVIRDYE